jgi:uncharacterized DUF497 family protein
MTAFLILRNFFILFSANLKNDLRLKNDLLYTPYIEDQRSEQPEQYRIVGFAEGKLTKFIVKYRVDEVGDYIWVVTAWKATKQEQKSYEERIY